MSISASIKRPSAWLPIMSMLLGFTVLAFLYGAAVVRYRVFPYNQLREAKQAAQSLWLIYFSDEEETELSSRSTKGGVTIRLTGRYQPGYNFITGCKQQQCGAWLMNDEGRTIHQWQIRFSEVWPRAPHLVYQAGDRSVNIHGAHLFPNGDIVFNYTGGNFPFGGGTVLLDKDSRVKWKLEKNTHHDLDVLPNGEMYITGHVLRFKADPRFPKLRAPSYYEEMIYLVGPDGRVLRVTSILEAIAKSPFAGLLALADDSWGESDDPLHSNNVEVLRTEYARAFPMFMPGDILVSLRQINTIGVIDGRSGVLKWALTGMFVGQHDPDFLSTGNILLFDNRGGDPKKGESRVIEIDPNTNRITWKYEGLEDHVFDSDIRGKQTRLENGNTLIVESQGGRVLEVDKQGEIVWEYINGTPDEDGIVRTVGLLTQADRVPVPYVTFLQ